MTTPSIQIAGQTFTKRVSKVRLPYIDEAVGYYLFGDSAGDSLANLAYGASDDLTVVGTPTYGAGYANISGANGFDTGLLLDTPYTQIAIAKITVATGGLAVISRGGGGDGFVNMLRLRDVVSNNPQVDTWPNGNQSSSITGLDAPGYRFFGARWGGSGTKSGAFAWDSDALLTANSSVNVAKTVTPTSNLLFGGGYTGNSAVARLAAAALFPFVMHEYQIREVYTYLKALLATRGITVL